MGATHTERTLHFINCVFSLQIDVANDDAHAASAAAAAAAPEAAPTMLIASAVRFKTPFTSMSQDAGLLAVMIERLLRLVLLLLPVGGSCDCIWRGRQRHLSLSEDMPLFGKRGTRLAMCPQ